MTRQQLWKARNRPKAAAHEAVRRATRAGTLARTACAACGHVKVQGHHPDYAQPLVVVWLCSRCHYQAHKEAQG